MARTLPTEESLGLSPTEDELNTSVTVDDGDDIPIGDDENEPALAPAKPGPEQKTKADDEPPADKPADTPQPDKPAEPPKMVDVRAVQEARAEAREARERANLLESRWNEFLAAQKAPQPEAKPAPVIPGPDDPMGRVNWTTEQWIAFNAEREQERQQREQQTAQEREFNQAFTKVNADFEAAAATDPTLNQAYNALRESQGKELLALGYSIPEARAELDRIERQHVMYVAQRGISIADHIKNLAQVRGWQAKAPEPTPAPVPAKTDLAAVAAAQQRHQSLSDAPGGEGIAPMDAKALAKMTDKQFKAWMSQKGNEEKFDQIMGA
jgi:hypothetical protein